MCARTLMHDADLRNPWKEGQSLNAGCAVTAVHKPLYETPFPHLFWLPIFSSNGRCNDVPRLRTIPINHSGFYLLQ